MPMSYDDFGTLNQKIFNAAVALRNQNWTWGDRIADGTRHIVVDAIESINTLRTRYFFYDRLQ